MKTQMRHSELDTFKYLEYLFIVQFGTFTCPKKPSVCTGTIVLKTITKFDLI